MDMERTVVLERTEGRGLPAFLPSIIAEAEPSEHIDYAESRLQEAPAPVEPATSGVPLIAHRPLEQQQQWLRCTRQRNET